jgi:hypothetical protein
MDADDKSWHSLVSMAMFEFPLRYRFAKLLCISRHYQTNASLDHSLMSFSLHARPWEVSIALLFVRIMMRVYHRNIPDIEVEFFSHD